MQNFLILGDGYASDGVRIFGRGKQLDTTPEAFTLLSDGYACDDKQIFWGDRSLNVDYASFEVLEDGHAEDRYHHIHGTTIKKKSGEIRV